MPKGLQSLLNVWRTDPTIQESISQWSVQPAISARFSDLPEDLEPGLRVILEGLGIRQLYSHQTQAYQSIVGGSHVVISTGTASGKSLCYQLPVLQSLMRFPGEVSALLLFPTKALAQDQHRAISELAPERLRSTIHIYDGDTSPSQRSAVRKSGRILLSNPDMLHLAVLPHHTLWMEFLHNLRFVVIDEIHAYRGVFGSHIANVLRRLKRVCAFYGAYPQFIYTSATISNPREFASQLLEEPVQVIQEDGAPHGERNFIIYNPPLVNKELGIRRSAMTEGMRLSGDLLSYNVQTLIFAQTRRAAEISLRYLRENHPQLTAELYAYRSGYLAEDRRQIENALKSGAAKAVASTNALELGVDIGSMDAVVILGYPGTIAATRQQSGRAGRKLDPAVGMLVATPNPIDQYLVNHPEYFLTRSPEKALINPDNPLILLQHIRCATFELPFRLEDGFGKLPAEVVHQYLEVLAQMGEVHLSGGRYFWTADQYPAQKVSLRTTEAGAVRLRTEEDGQLRTIGMVDTPSAHWMVHPHAIYLHQARTYLVESLDLSDGQAILRQVDTDYFTEPLIEEQIHKVELYRSQTVPAGEINLGEVDVTSRVTGFRKTRWYSNENLGAETLEMPSTTLRTVAYWLSLARTAISLLDDARLWSGSPNDYGPNWDQMRSLARQRDHYECQNCGRPENGTAHHVHHKIPFRQFPSFILANQLDNLVTLCPGCHRQAEMMVRMRSGMAGLAYALGHLAPLFIMCDPNDLGAHFLPESDLAEGAPVVILYDRVPAGIGLSENIYQMHGELIRACLELVQGCSCLDGCPSCVGVAGEKIAGGKQETLAILQLLNGLPLSV
jgi:DEAD/DEAH box helicase domain-containing protein